METIDGSATSWEQGSIERLKRKNLCALLDLETLRSINAGRRQSNSCTTRNLGSAGVMAKMQA
jgi:hypothetical protein